MKKILFLLLLILLFPPPVRAVDSWRFPGVMFKPWDQTNENFAVTCPECGPMGGIYFVGWNQIHNGIGNYNFGRIMNVLNQARTLQTASFPGGRRLAKPILIELSFLRSEADYTPGWVYNSGAVPKSAVCDGKTIQVPPYDSYIWKQAYFDIIKGLGDYFSRHIAEYPNLAGIIIGPGYNDEAYPIVSHCQNAAAANGYGGFLSELLEVVGRYYTGVPVYVTSGGNNAGVVAEKAREKHFGVKTNTLSVGGESCCFAWSCPAGTYREILGNPACASLARPHSAALKTAEEISWGFEDARNWNYNRPWETYFQWLIPLSLHADWIDWRDIAVFKTMSQAYPDFVKKFVPDYLGQKKTRTPGVWLALRDIKDSAIYSQDLPNQEIYCWQNNGPNCHSHMIGDLAFYLTRVGDSGSRPVFRENFPAPAQAQPYGFGREIVSGQGLSLKVEDGVWFKSGSRNLTFKAILLNSGSGSLIIELRKANGSVHREVITKGGGLGAGDRFVEVARNIPAVVFTGSFPGGGDVRLLAEGGSVIVHMVEIKPTGTGESPSPTVPTAMPTQTPAGQPTANPPTANPTAAATAVPSQGASLAFLSEGWNTFTWSSSWPANFSFRDLPLACPYVVYQKDYWFTSYVRDYAPEENFVPGWEYYVFCLTEAGWFR